MVCKRQEQCVFGEKCIYHIGSVLPKCSIFEQKPPIKQTEQEYIQTCTTEQLAEFLTKVILDDKRFRMTMVGGVNETKLWLKQPHQSVTNCNE